MAKWNLADALGDVSKLNTAAEQIVLIPADRIDPDDNNFYSLEGLEDLAASIELLGLQQPLRVRPSGERYIVVSGHRRRAAIMLINDGGSEQFAAGIPCIVEYGEASPAMQELRLIYANAMTRVLTTAELSKQAERVEALLYQLKEQGVEFPGRMRDHVAQACQVSASKLARLHAIRANLAPELLEKYFDKGEISESTAYTLSRLPATVQMACIDTYLAKKNAETYGLRYLWADTAEKFGKEYQRLETQKCPRDKTAPCCPERETILARRFSDGHFWQCSGCCEKCSSLADCRRVCSMCADSAAAMKAQRKEARKTEKALQRNADEQKIREIELYWFRFGQALRASGLSHKELAEKMGMEAVRGFDETSVFNWSFFEKEAEQLEDGSFTETKPNTNLPYGWSMSLAAARNLCKMASALGASLDYLFCRTDNPEGFFSVNAGTNGAPKLPPRPGEEVTGKMIQLSFDEVAERVGKILVLDRSTQSRASFVAVKVLKIVPYEGMRRAICSVGGRKGNELLINEYNYDRGTYPPRMYELAEDREIRARRKMLSEVTPLSWQDGNPETDGWYVVKVQICQTDLIVRKVLWWSDGSWFLTDRPDAHCLDETNEVKAWLPLPEE